MLNLAMASLISSGVLERFSSGIFSSATVCVANTCGEGGGSLEAPVEKRRGVLSNCGNSRSKESRLTGFFDRASPSAEHAGVPQPWVGLVGVPGVDFRSSMAKNTGTGEVSMRPGERDVLVGKMSARWWRVACDAMRCDAIVSALGGDAHVQVVQPGGHGENEVKERGRGSESGSGPGQWKEDKSVGGEDKQQQRQEQDMFGRRFRGSAVTQLRLIYLGVLAAAGVVMMEIEVGWVGHGSALAWSVRPVYLTLLYLAVRCAYWYPLLFSLPPRHHIIPRPRHTHNMATPGYSPP